MEEKELIELAKRNTGISIEEIHQDIIETQQEITELRWKIWNYNWKLDITYNSEIKQREDFILKLENIIKWRNLIINN